MTQLRSVAVYCGSSDRGPDSHRRLAAALGRTLAGAGITLVYGGGRIGLMREVADAAIAAGGEVVGVIPGFLDRREVGHPGVARLEVVASMHERKARMAELADAFVVLPGGLGTLDEAFEIVTWRQLGLHDKPVVVLDDDGYWAPLRALVDAIVTNGYARAEHGRLLTFVARLEDVLPALAAITGPDQGVDRARL
ncbi:MAG: TIGR00730 family Rossman fold protein [Alphaproteobacteria bacterium]|nr:TIGR00730 family Rossman fold protein [Alphaproteobacteria bacterium]